MITEQKPQTDTEVLITRVFNAPRELVFRAWSEPEQLARWFAPQGCTIRFLEFDFAVGGSFRSEMDTPAGTGCQTVGVYNEIVAPERIVYTWYFCDDEGNIVDATPSFLDPEWPSVNTVTISLEEADGKTTMTLHQNVSETLARRTGAYPSWLQMFERLDAEVLQVDQG